jgi:hypothetical protein
VLDVGTARIGCNLAGLLLGFLCGFVERSLANRLVTSEARLFLHDGLRTISGTILGATYLIAVALFAATLQPINLLPIAAIVVGSLAGGYAARITSRLIGEHRARNIYRRMRHRD